MLSSCLHQRALLRTIDAMGFPEREESTGLELRIRDRNIIGQWSKKLESEKDERKDAESEDKREKVVVQIHDAIEHTDCGHKADIQSQEN